MSALAIDMVSVIKKEDKYSVFIAEDEYTKQLCYKLRYNVFAEELGAEIVIENNAMDKDRFDNHCHHLVVYDNKTNEIVATTRLLDNDGRKETGMFYSETEFDISNIFNPDVNYIEVGRTCIHPDYRRGAVLAMLWRGIAEIVVSENIDYLIGCASIPFNNGDQYIASVMDQIHKYHYAPESLRVRPLVPLRLNMEQVNDEATLPTLLKAYIRQGALICGEPYWDAAFGVADVFVLLEAGNITSRYSKHFISRVDS